MRMLKYELKRFLLGGIITLAFISFLMILSIFYETNLEYAIDQIVLIIALFGFLVYSVVVFIKQYRMQQILYYHADDQGYMRIYSFALTMTIFMLGIFIFGLIIINIKAMIVYLSDYYLFLQNGIDQYVFVFVYKYWYEILMMLFVYVFNILISILVVTYGIFLVNYKVRNERLYTNKKTIIINILWLIGVHIFYRIFIFILYRPLSFLDFNQFSYYDLISYGNKLLFINPLFLPALFVFGLEVYRMYIDVKKLTSES